MAISAKFQADYSSFIAATQAAEIKIRSFEDSSAKAGTAVQKMANSLSGTSIIQQATVMAEAVERVGGVSKLTEKELARVSATASEAAAKLRAMGQDVPPGIQKIADATKGATQQVTNWKGMLSSAAGAFGVAFSVGAVVNFTKSVFDAAGRINDLASQLGVSTNAAQGFKFAAEQSGSSIDAVGRSINKMNDNLAGGSKSTVQALKDAGLEFAAIRGMKPEDAFLAITDAIQRIPDPMRQTQVAMELFGKSGAELLPAIKEGFRGVSDGAAKMSEDTIKSLDKAGDAWQRLADRVTIISGTLIAAAMDASTRVTASWTSFTMFAENALKFGVGTAVAMAKAQEEAARSAGKSRDVHLTMPPVIEKVTTATRAYTRAVQDVIALTPQQVQINDLLAKAKAHERAELEFATSAWKAWERSASQALANVTAQSAPLKLMTRDLSSFTEMVSETAASSAGNLAGGLGVASDGLGVVRQRALDARDALGNLTQAFDVMASAANGDIGSVIRSLGDLAASIETAARFQASVGGGAPGTGGEGGSGGGMLGKIGTIAAYASVYGAVAIAAFKAGKAIYTAMNDGRKAVEDFAKSFGGFSALRQEMIALGDEGERLWIKLTQQTGRGDQNAAAKVIKEIKDALANSPEALAAAAGFQTREQLQAVADKAKATYEYMRDSGKYTAEAIAAAFQASKDAQIAAIGDTSKAHQDELDAITAKYADRISKIESEYKGLSESVAKEAEEEHMGITEMLERERMKQLQEEKAFQEAQRDAEIEAKKSTFDEILDAGEKVDKELRELFGKTLEIPYKFVPEGGGSVPGTSTYTGPARPPAVVGGTVPVVVQNTLSLDGRTVATSISNARAKLRMT